MSDKTTDIVAQAGTRPLDFKSRSPTRAVDCPTESGENAQTFSSICSFSVTNKAVKIADATDYKESHGPNCINLIDPFAGRDLIMKTPPSTRSMAGLA